MIPRGLALVVVHHRPVIGLLATEPLTGIELR
ncbi:hypothetical protein AN403_6072 [Pseudomonas fluorescens]|uniref:Uncharacterized protein n=1 Tax=Pseudomonas fluorescens TaxID=294 RepID=A0A0P8Z980_PSEFL|nr:hypothetical protein AN403_6072 [Pseudomonas fluorescens]